MFLQLHCMCIDDTSNRIRGASFFFDLLASVLACLRAPFFMGSAPSRTSPIVDRDGKAGSRRLLRQTTKRILGGGMNMLGSSRSLLASGLISGSSRNLFGTPPAKVMPRKPSTSAAFLAVGAGVHLEAEGRKSRLRRSKTWSEADPSSRNSRGSRSALEALKDRPSGRIELTAGLAERAAEFDLVGVSPQQDSTCVQSRSSCSPRIESTIHPPCPFGC